MAYYNLEDLAQLPKSLTSPQAIKAQLAATTQKAIAQNVATGKMTAQKAQELTQAYVTPYLAPAQTQIIYGQPQSGFNLNALIKSPWIWLGIFGLGAVGILIFVKPKKRSNHGILY